MEVPQSQMGWITPKMRKCRDGNSHEGTLQLITWTQTLDFGAKLGWGNTFIDEADDLKKKFEEDFGKDEKKLFDTWPRAFRWTCCGLNADSGTDGCDHHGSGSAGCTCDFCKMGEPVPESVMREINTHGLQVDSGPDPRSYNASTAELNRRMREMFGLPNNPK